jgi:hypothetical protein
MNQMRSVVVTGAFADILSQRDKVQDADWGCRGSLPTPQR